MRVTTLLRRLIRIDGLTVQGFKLDSRGLTVDVRPRWRKPRCGICGLGRPSYDRAGVRTWRHLNWSDHRVWLRCELRRVRCQRCGIRVEQVPWASQGSRFTRDFEEMVAYLAQTTDKSKVSKLMRIAWPTVTRIIERVISERLDPQRLQGLRRIGVDEFSYRRRHRYLSVVLDHDRGRIVWAGEGRGSSTLDAFFERMGPEGCAALRVITMDMAGGYKGSAARHAPNAQVVFDRFHVQRLASVAVDRVRRDQLRILRGTTAGRILFKSRFALWRNPWNLSESDRQKLSDIERSNRPLYRAYLLKEALARALDYRQPKRAREALESWIAWASRSRLAPFVRAARTVRKHFDGILAYVSERLTNAAVEGRNTRLRMVARRAYGYHTPEALISMFYLCCGGIKLKPRLP